MGRLKSLGPNPDPMIGLGAALVAGVLFVAAVVAVIGGLGWLILKAGGLI